MRAQDILTWLESLVRDFRYGLRQLRKTPAVTAIIVLSLALGIGANSAIFNLVDAALFKPLPVRNPQALTLIEWTDRGWPEGLCHLITGDSHHKPNGEMRATSIARRIQPSSSALFMSARGAWLARMFLKADKFRRSLCIYSMQRKTRTPNSLNKI